ncbi:MAG: imidazoleglycerol-phosphate dehydratase [Acidobacteriota bacterium]
MSEIQTLRAASVVRETKETQIRVHLGLDGAFPATAAFDDAQAGRIATPDGFLTHMLDALATHGGLALDVAAAGDVEVDLHHTVEDVGIALGAALRDALGDRAGIVRFGHAYAPLDEALARAVVDLSGRGFCVHTVPEALAQAWIKPTFSLDLVHDFLHAFADRGRFTLHLDVLRARNAHHAAEAGFKALALALRAAVARRPGGVVPSTKGTLTR